MVNECHFRTLCSKYLIVQDELAKNGSALVIAHRLSTVMDAQKIYVLGGTKDGDRQGIVLESGTHTELLATEQDADDVEAIFAGFDLDNSGTIDATEMQKLGTALGYVWSPEQTASILKQVDADNSGTVDIAEFRARWKKCWAGKLSTKTPTPSIPKMSQHRSPITR